MTLIFILLFTGIDLQTVMAQEKTGDIDVGGVWRFKGENKFHIEFSKTGSQLVATFVYDDKELKSDYGERLPFFTVILNGRKFNGRMDYYQSRGAIITGKINIDNRTIEFINGSRAQENVLYRQ
jgi:hypothetical protein